LREYAQERREPGQVVTLVVAVLFVLAAALDVGPGLMDNLVHLGFGLVGFALSRGPRAAHAYLISGGVAYFLLWQFGTVIDPALVPFHTTNAVIHLSLVASMIGLAVLSGGDRTPEPVAEPEFEYLRDTPDVVRPRQARNRPPGRGDRRTSRMAAAGRPPGGVACRA
jgi:hypothetical protein